MQLKLSIVAGLVASFTLALGAPTKQDKGINVSLSKRGSLTKENSERVDWTKFRSHMNHLESKYANNLKNYERNTGKAHRLQKDVPATHKRRDTGSVALTDQHNGLVWTGNIAFGTPAQTFPIDFDTGSADTIVNKGVYQPSASKTSQKTGKSFSAGYGDGTKARGNIYTDALQIGGTDSSKFQGDIVWSPVSANDGFWVTPAAVNGQKIHSVVDSGTTAIVAPTDQAIALFDKLGLKYETDSSGTTWATFDCHKPPIVTFTFSGKDITLSPETTYFGKESDGSCLFVVTGGDVGMDAWITGDSFFQNTVAIFDVDNNRVGFADKA